MSGPEIRETTATPDADGSVVQLHISDAPPLSESPGIRLQLSVKIPAYETPLLAHLQREVMKRAKDVLEALLQKLASEIQHQPDNELNPKLKP